MMGVGALSFPTLMDIMSSDGSGWSELRSGIEFNHPPTNLKLCRVVGVGALNSPTLIMLSDGSGRSEFPNPNGYHVEWWEWLIWTHKWNWIQSPPTNLKLCRVVGVGALNSPTLMDIMLSNGSGCSEFPKPTGYHVEWWEWVLWVSQP